MSCIVTNVKTIRIYFELRNRELMSLKSFSSKIKDFPLEDNFSLECTDDISFNLLYPFDIFFLYFIFYFRN